MKLEINLADRDEIAAAVPLLQLILNNTATTSCAGACKHEALTGQQTAPAVDEFAEAHGGRSKNMEDPAAVFGGVAVAAPLAASIPPAPVPSTIAPLPPANIAPITTTPGPASLGAGAASVVVERDNRGFAWDSRIHSSAKSKLTNGNWKVARGKAPEYVAQVEAELAASATPAAQGVPPAPVVPTAPQAVPLPPAAMVAPSVNADPATFEQIMPRITTAVTSGIMPPTAIGEACVANGLASVVALQTAPHFVPLVWATLKQQFPALV